MHAAEVVADSDDGEYHDDREEMTEEQLETEALAKDVVAHSIEEKMYPDAHINGDGKQQAAPQQAPQSAAPQQETPRAFAPQQQPQAAMPEMPQAQQPAQPMPEQAQAPSATAVAPEPQVSDDWKSYEVKESKQDWSSYEVPRQEAPAARQPAQPQAQQPQPAAEEGPSDSEVEEALSGLSEMGSQKPAQPQAQQAQPAQPQPGPQQPQATPAQPKPEAEAEAEEDSGDQKWSIEELRKNLTNMDRDG
jgi:hypothetical protein